MKRTTIMIPDNLKTRAIKRANQMGMSLGGFIRESLEKALIPASGEPSDEIDDTFFADNAVFHGEVPGDLAESHDEYLYGDKL